MKYNTISTSSLASEGRKSTLTIYADLNLPKMKMYSETEVSSMRGELEIAQKALKLQTKRCRQLVAEYTRRLQEKEQQYQSEKSLRDDQLAKVLKALLIFEARLKQEQKFITHQLNEKDYTINDQRNHITKLLENQYCKNCNQYYRPSPQLESLDSSSEYVTTEYQDYQSSNFESLDSSSETYAQVSEKTNSRSDTEVDKSDNSKSFYQKNKNNSLGRRSRKLQHRKSIGTYFEVLKLRNDSPLSNDDNTSADYDNFDSLPPESISDKISLVSENIESIFNKNQELMAVNASDSSTALSLSECNNTVINKNLQAGSTNQIVQDPRVCNTVINESKQRLQDETVSTVDKTGESSKITEAISVFEGDGENNENWYASASDQEYEEQNTDYRDNPVLECVNQILLQNMNDPLNSPPKTPNTDRKPIKNKRVKFSDEKKLTEENLKAKQEDNHDYYETPVQKTPNFYETPQSIYSNDYEQILSKCSESFSSSNNENLQTILPEKKINHYYIDMENKQENENVENFVRKSKILRKPPALPPKPPNLVSKYKIQAAPKKPYVEKISSKDSESDYCSISELNLPQNKQVSFKKINVVAEVHAPTSHDVIHKAVTPKNSDVFSKNVNDYDPVNIKESVPNLVVKKCVEKLNIQLARQTSTKETAFQQSPQKKIDHEIPKLPQVSEIIIPDDTEEKQHEERISQDNYVKNNSQIFKSKPNEARKPIVMGTSVSNLISGFNNHPILSDIKKEKNRLDKNLFSSFENLQNVDKQFSLGGEKCETPSFESFDLSQNFEEFKLDDCEIEEYNVEDELNEEEKVEIMSKDSDQKSPSSSTRVELIRATSDMVMPNLNPNSIELLKNQLKLQKDKIPIENVSKDNTPSVALNEPTYEHFLECTGLSSKSIVTASRLVSNHKSMLKPKDIKLRSKVKANNTLFERNSGSSIKYWSEPYI